MVKNPPVMQETQVQSLSWEDSLEKEMATHPSSLAFRIPWTKERGLLQSTESQRVDHDLATGQQRQQSVSLPTSFSFDVVLGL